MKTTLPSYSTPRRLSWIAGLIFLILSTASITACSDEPEGNGSDTGIVTDAGDTDVVEPEDIDPQDDVEPTDVPVIPDDVDVVDDVDATDDVDAADDVDATADVDTGTDVDTGPGPDVTPEVLLAIEAIKPNRGSVAGNPRVLPA